MALLAALLALVASQTHDGAAVAADSIEDRADGGDDRAARLRDGHAVPHALRRLEEWHAPSVRWAWSLNAASSVLGSVGALMCAIYLGLAQTLIIGGLFYLAAMGVLARVHVPGDAGSRAGSGRVMLAS